MSDRLPGFEIRPNIILSSPNSISRALKPEYFALNELDYQVPRDVLEFAEPERFAKNLYDLPQRNDNKFVLPYRADNPDPRLNKLVFVALTPEEYKLMYRSRSADALANLAMSTTIASKPIDNLERTNSSATRAGLHALENKLFVMERYKNNTLSNDLKILDRIIEATKYPGLARGKEDKMREDMEWIFSHVLENMFVALRYQKNWNQEQESLARKSVQRNIFFERDNNKHIGYFRKLMKVNKSWLVRKNALIDDRASEIQRFLNEE